MKMQLFMRAASFKHSLLYVDVSGGLCLHR